MLKIDRHKIIIDEVNAKARVESLLLCELLQVSIDTVRRDIAELEKNGQVKRVRGGASLLSFVPVFKECEIEKNESGCIIAKKALNLIEDGQTLIIGGGTTNLQLVNLLPADARITIFTNSIPIAYKLCEYPNIDGVLLGGSIANEGRTTVGYFSIDLLGEIMADICFLGISGVHSMCGLSEINRKDIVLQKAFLKASNKVVALAASNKLQSQKTYKVGDIDCLDILITELAPTEDILAPFIANGISVL